ncbi:TonB-dependent receptor [Alloacidobacterium dinghuense]|uniref:TonB-dependent receptor n=1 Tax=Alloacidobacterium dinghuense TaxID=2763107 RepID=A0A7G8BFS1_9BACT|nr:TonB-dependent receptor [Alloacidobacterium dinghuense]QNI31391.1 TonB-dependent receptor [Alloacidobacterium dinghuense]
MLKLRIALLCALLLVSCCRTVAQSTTGGAIAGTILDAEGRAIPNAQVALRNPATGFERNAKTSEAGGFYFEELTPGTYTLMAGADGFAPLVEQSITVEIGRLTHIVPRLAVGTAQETVSVNASPQIDTTSAAVTQNINQTEVDELPTNSRRWSNFALLAPGVTPDQNGYGLLSFRGISVLLNNNTIDGADNNQAFFSEERGRTRIGYSTTQAAVREFQVNTSNYSAEYGRAAGGVVNTVTKSGGNEVHGQLFFYDRDNNWGATNPFTTLTSRTSTGDFVTTPFKPSDVRKQWGLSAGGPIRKDKLFWFLAYDQFRRDFPAVATAETPSKFFEMQSAQNIATLAARIQQTPTQALISYNNLLNNLNSLLGSVPRSGDQIIFFPKIDWQLNERNHLILQYNHMRWSSLNGVQTGASENYGTASFGNDYVKEDWGIARWQYFVTANMLNEARYQYGRDTESEFSDAPAPFEQSLSKNVYGHAPQISIASGSYGFRFGKPAFLDRPAYPDERRHQFVDTLTWIKGNHAIKFGYDLNYVTDYSDNLYDQNGTYDYTNPLDFAADYYSPNHCSGTTTGVGDLPCYSYFEQGVGFTTFQFQTADYAGFISDEWKLRHGLTLSLGMRYEYEELPNTNKNLVNPDIPQTATLPHDRNNFGPRLGLAWDIFGKGSTVLRIGYGIYYGRIINSTIFTALSSTGSPNGQLTYFYRPTDKGTPPFPYVFSAKPTLSVAPNAVFFDPRFQNPQIHQAEVSFEQALPRKTTITFTYMGSAGRELPNFIDTNIDLTGNQPFKTITYTIDDATGKGPLHGAYTTNFFSQRINPNYQQITDIFSETNSAYQAGVARLSHHSRALDLTGSYTYAHAADYNQNESTFADLNDVLDPTNFKLEYGNSNFDIRQRVTASAVARAPWRVHGFWGYLVNGYLVAPVAELRTGLPFTMRTTGSVPSLECSYEQFLLGICPSTKVSGLGASINGSGGANRIPAVGRNTFRYPRVYNVDARLAKNTQIGERYNLEVVSEIFNVLNHQNATNIDTVGYIINGATTPGGNARLTFLSGANGTARFGTVTNANSTTLYRERQLQLALRLRF